MKPVEKGRVPGSLVLFLILFLITIVLVSLFRDFLRENVLIPLLRMFWLVGLVVKSIDQICIWAVAIFVIALFSLARLRRVPQEDNERVAAGLNVAPDKGRVWFWKTQLRLNSEEVVLSRFLSAELRRLLLEILAYRDHLSPLEVSRLVREGRMKVPAEVYAVLEVSDAPLEIHASPVHRLISLMRSWRRKLLPEKGRSTDKFAEIAQYLENTIEE